MLELIQQLIQELSVEKQNHICKCAKNGNSEDNEVKLLIATVCTRLRLNKFDTGIQRILMDLMVEEDAPLLPKKVPKVKKVKKVEPKVLTLSQTPAATDVLINKSQKPTVHVSKRTFFNL